MGGTKSRAQAGPRMPSPEARHWRERAKEAARLAAQMSDPDCRRAMLQVADGYKRLAERAERTD